MRKFILASILPLAAAGSAHAYKFESSFAYSNLESDFLVFDSHTFSVTGKSYMQDVDVGTKPIREAAFLEQIGGLNASYTHTDPGSTEFSTIIVGGDIWMQNLYLNLQFAQVASEGFDSEQAFTAEIGHAPTNDSLFTVGILATEFETNVTARGKYLLNMHSDNPVNILFSYRQSEPDSVYLLGLDYYFDNTLSVGVALNNNDLTGINMQKFFTPDISVGALFQSQRSLNILGINGTFRF